MKRAFAIACHPDDIEFMMAGTLIVLKKAGYEIHYMNTANGSCGTNAYDTKTIVRMRRAEAKEAAESIGAVYHGSLANDIEIFYEKKLLARMGAIIREVAPDIILTHMPYEYMEDHSNTCRLVVSAAFCRGMPNFPVTPKTAIVDNPVTIYHSLPYGLNDPLGKPVKPGLFVDISSVIDTKVKMLAMHRTQKEWLDESQGMDSYLIAMKDMSRKVGRMSGKYKFAEGWTRHSHLGFCGEKDNPLAGVFK